MFQVETENAVMIEPESDPKVPRIREWLGLLAIILLAAGLRLWRLDQNGYGNPYYAAAVRSMLASGSNFFFGAFDPAGFITVDKPPTALWFQAIGAKLLGFRGISLLLPQALMGIASVVLTYHLVRRVFGAGAGLLAGLLLAITPISVAVDRDNLPDSALVLVLLLAAWALTRAAEAGRLGPLLLSTALVGVGFNIKMLAAFVVLPTFYLAYFLAAPVGWRARLGHLTAATAVLVLVSLSWSIAVELTPKGRRPYIGGSRNNSAFDLALGYNGLGRVFGGSGNLGPPGSRPRPGIGLPKKDGAGTGPARAKADRSAEAGTSAVAGGDGTMKLAVADNKVKMAAPLDEDPDDDVPPPPPGGPGAGFPPFPPGGPGPWPFPGGPGGPGGRFRGGPPGFGGTPGLLRFAGPSIAGQITWLFPLAILGAALAAARAGGGRPIGPEPLALLLWSGWLGTHWVVFSFARGIFHEYYTTIMGPALASMVGIGAIALGDEARRGGWRSLLFPSALVLTAAWQAFIINRTPGWRNWLLPVLLGGVGVGTIGVLGSRWLAARWGSIPWAKLAAGIGLAALLVGPSAWSLAPVLARGNPVIPSADPSALTGRGRDGMPPMPPFGMGGRGTEKLVEFLRANRHGERYLVAAPSCMEVSPIIIETGEPAISLGGFIGADRVITKDQFARMVEDGQLRFVMFGPGPGGGRFGGPPGGGFGGPPGGGPGGGPGNAEILAWVRENGEPVDPKLWREEEPTEQDAAAEGGPGGPPGGPGPNFRRMQRMRQLYDCRPELGLVIPSDR
jgi:4-amino-4-deoxy-L-arabinose transferase-like glycosyltransferase